MTFLKFIRQICLTIVACYCIQLSFVQVANAQGLMTGDWLYNPQTLNAKGVEDGKAYKIKPTKMIIVFIASKDASETNVKLVQPDPKAINDAKRGEIRVQVPPDRIQNKDKSNPHFRFDQEYVISEDDAKSCGDSGVAYGALFVPFKYQLTGNHDTYGSMSLGSYIGLRNTPPFQRNVDITFPLVFAGPSYATSTSTSTTVMGISYGGGLLVAVNGAFYVGAVIGWDSISKTAGYQYNNKPWLALQVGWDISKK